MGPRSEEFVTTVVRRGPTNRRPMNTIYDWLEGKRVDDGAEGLWRVHDKLYDLSKWLNNHPGGRDWLEVTKGTDITEAFECSHLTDKAEKLLKQFYVRNAKKPRNSLITFHEKGFFRTFKRKIRERNLLPETGPLPKTKFFTDSLAVSVFVLGLLGTVHSVWWAVASGILLNMLAVCSHNFFHMKDNWRMYYFNLLLFSYRDWRVSHVLSHHLYPNTTLDLEISMYEPFFRFLPREKMFRHLAVLISPFVMASASLYQFFRRGVDMYILKRTAFMWEDMIGFSLFFFLLAFGGQGIWKTFLVWGVIILSGCFSFALVGLTAGHHHPDIYHDGDFLGNDKDFGVLQLAAVRNRFDVDGNFMKTMVLFGEHALHHILPTVDHGRLPVLDSVLEETCKEFKINHKPQPAKKLFFGMFQQLIRNCVNSRLMIFER